MTIDDGRASRNSPSRGAGLSEDPARRPPPGPQRLRPSPARLLPRPRPVTRWPGIIGVAAALGLAFAATGSRTPWPPEPTVAPPEDTGVVVLRSWKEAARRVEEDRRERVGNRAIVPVPPELLHYDDRRRFLAVQVAATKQRDYAVPGDDADLAALVRSGELVEMSPVGEAYVLYGVGAHATGEQFSYYDRETGLDIPLYSDYLAFEEGDRALDHTVGRLQEKVARLRTARARLPRKAATRRRVLYAEVRRLERETDRLMRRQERVATLYEDYDERRRLAGRLRLLHQTADDLDRRDYDLDEAEGRRAFRGRLLSLIRPEARDVLLRIAASYQEVFDRPLPVTSLVRSRRYQERLRRTNRNATAVDPPPHATGLAFDVYTGRMTATEQAHLLSAVAGLEQAGRLEALFERNRNHIHVFVFADGAPPAETLIAESLETLRPSAPARRAAPQARKGPPPAMPAAAPARPALPAR